MPSRKRIEHPTGSDSGDELSSTLHHIRNMWQFANLCQWIYMFGKAAKIDDAIDIEVGDHIPDDLCYQYYLTKICIWHRSGDGNGLPKTATTAALGHSTSFAQAGLLTSWTYVSSPNRP